ncbi:SWIM zinc finger family protein [Corynebacterium aquilae]|uniref:SWIM-type domain-containing protein n=1 Tax=Corynebacterium aquilae DSM 44791 TaxID=1431546 RepID=A0A1L7CFC1_9CORY|nr:SWIM zinc finger family protein [Corynebacterium aquilae]APT84527.1 hypothetical protein CAQU_05055 [Corynebacterium aquilae DSM 44791]
MAKKDNVIYVNFGAPTPGTPEPTPASPHYTSDNATSLAGAMIYDAVVANADAGRISRGKAYAANGAVVRLSLTPGLIRGVIAGSQPEPFHASIELSHPTAAHMQEIVDALATTPGGKIGLMRAVHSPTGLNMLLLGQRPTQQDSTPPYSRVPVTLNCSCPDYARGNTCKHLVALALATNDRLNTNPETIFDLFHLTADTLINAQLAHHNTPKTTGHTTGETTTDSQPDTPTAEHFWQGHPLPDIPELGVRDSLEHGDIRHLRAALRVITYSRFEEMRIIDELRDIFDDIIDTGSFDDHDIDLTQAPTGDGWDNYRTLGDHNQPLPRLKDHTPHFDDDTPPTP